MEVETVYIHPDYNKDVLRNDISILLLTTAIIFSKVAQPIELATYEPAQRTKLLVSGWGALIEGGSSSNVLQSVNIEAISRDKCQQRYNFNITNDMICAGIPNKGGKDACQGDSGGPLVVRERRERKLLGIVSYGIGCARPNYPGVYANIVELGAFVRSVVFIKT